MPRGGEEKEEKRREGEGEEKKKTPSTRVQRAGCDGGMPPPTRNSDQKLKNYFLSGGGRAFLPVGRVPGALSRLLFLAPSPAYCKHLQCNSVALPRSSPTVSRRLSGSFSRVPRGASSPGPRARDTNSSRATNHPPRSSTHSAAAGYALPPAGWRAFNLGPTEITGGFLRANLPFTTERFFPPRKGVPPAALSREFLLPTVRCTLLFPPPTSLGIILRLIKRLLIGDNVKRT